MSSQIWPFFRSNEEKRDVWRFLRTSQATLRRISMESLRRYCCVPWSFEYKPSKYSVCKVVTITTNSTLATEKKMLDVTPSSSK